MAVTLATMRTNVLLKVGNKTGIDATVNDNIDKAQLYVCFTFRPQELWATKVFATSNKKSEYAFVTDLGLNDVYAILMVRDDTKDREILRGSMRHYNRLTQDTAVASTLGDPRRWTRSGNSLVLYSRIPDSTTRNVKLTYLKRPPSLAGAGVLALNEEWQRPIEEYAAFLTWNDLNQFEKANARLGSFQALVSTMEQPEAIEDEAPEAAVRPYVDPSDRW